jgi:hypothetical protein
MCPVSVNRTELLECYGDQDFLAKLHCVRQAFQVSIVFMSGMSWSCAVCHGHVMVMCSMSWSCPVCHGHASMSWSCHGHVMVISSMSWSCPVCHGHVQYVMVMSWSCHGHVQYVMVMSWSCHGHVQYVMVMSSMSWSFYNPYNPILRTIYWAIGIIPKQT